MWTNILFQLEVWRRKIRRALGRRDLIRRALGLAVAADSNTNAPGLLLVQIDALSCRQSQPAPGSEQMPFLNSLFSREGYRLIPFRAKPPFSPIALLGELYYNVPGAAPAVASAGRNQEDSSLVDDPEIVCRFEAELRQRGEEPLLLGGSSWGNVFSGGARPEETHFRTRRFHAGEMLRFRSIARLLAAAALYLPGLIRLSFLASLEMISGVWGMARAVLAGATFSEAWRLLISRVLSGAVLREILTLGATLDLQRGLPIIHVNFPASDERFPPRGAKPGLARSDLGHLDRALKQLHRAAELSDRRDYQVWIFSDQGPETLQPLDHERGDEIEPITHDAPNAHHGPAPNEIQGFVLLPPWARLPSETETFLRPSTLRQAILFALGRRKTGFPILTPGVTRTGQFRIVTYNVHSCIGLDGRLSPARIIRILQGYHPDVLALQEVDIQRARSRGENQARRIAQDLGMNFVFCTTMSNRREQYGHMLLSRFPLESVACELLSARNPGSRPEPRGALLARVMMGSKAVYVLNTHLGLSRTERQAQVQELLGPEWIGRLQPGDPLVACGDFNMLPGSAAYHLMAARLSDADVLAGPNMRRPTFVSTYPITRIDYFFLNARVGIVSLRAPRSSLTSVASDHLPLIADLKLLPAEQAFLERRLEKA